MSDEPELEVSGRPPAAALSLPGLLFPTRDGAAPVERLLWLCSRVSLSAAELMDVTRTGEELTNDDWKRIAALAGANGVETLLFTHIAAAGLLDRVPPAIVARMRQRYGEVAIGGRRLEMALGRVLPLLERTQAPVIIVKGLPLARRLYGNIALRPVSDIDLMIRIEDGPTVAAALRAAGFTPVAGKSAPLSRHALRFREMQFQDAKGRIIEAHVNPCRYPAYRRAFAPEPIWAAAAPLSGPYHWGLGLAPHDELRFLCMHYAIQHHIGRLIWLTDVAEIARRVPDTPAWDALAADAISRGAAAPVAVTLARARALLDAPVPEAALDRLRSAALATAERSAWESATREMSGLRWYLSQMTLMRSPLERAALFWNGSAAFAGRLRRRVTRRGSRRADP
ncbi:MAG TPA: nucleotidyltransferase family protein [Ktedonobacterales bacterium]